MKIIEYFKHIPISEQCLTVNSQCAVVSHPLKAIGLSGLVSCLFLSISACSQISSTGKVNHSLIRNSSRAEETGRLSKPVNLNGNWKIGFRYQGKTGLGNMQIRQSNQNFVGSGKDADNNATFTVDHGTIKGNEIIFLKRYDSRPNQALQCHGKFSYLSTEGGESPYMGGDFSAEGNGGIIVGDWEAAMIEVKPAPVVPSYRPKPEIQQPVPVESANIERAPDLSGKWNVGYEYNFKNIHSTMFLEQDGNKLTGHGIDLNSKEKFVIKKGWYSFPHITIVRQYVSGSMPGKTMAFKAEVSEVSDKDYTGPYLSGKTQGGGDWEAERVN